MLRGQHRHSVLRDSLTLLLHSCALQVSLSLCSILKGAARTVDKFRWFGDLRQVDQYPRCYSRTQGFLCGFPKSVIGVPRSDPIGLRMQNKGKPCMTLPSGVLCRGYGDKTFPSGNRDSAGFLPRRSVGRKISDFTLCQPCGQTEYSLYSLHRFKHRFNYIITNQREIIWLFTTHIINAKYQLKTRSKTQDCKSQIHQSLTGQGP